MSGARDPERLARLLALYERAVELEDSEREAFLESACGDDPTLRLELEVLLADDGSGSSRFLEPPGMPSHGSKPGTGSGALDPKRKGTDAGAVPFQLGPFDLVSELGRGSSGVVYLASERSLGRQVALKVLSTNVTTTRDQVERFHREAQAVAKLDHPGIVRIHSDGVEGANHWFAMEYVEGRDLAREVELQRLVSVLPGEQPILPRPGERDHAARVAELVARVARALHAAHRAGIVHRDVKPSNILLGADGSVRVADFGLARDAAFGSVSATGDVAGTPHYMSPEQARVERASVDHRTDVYSLGVVLYELCTLRRPFEGKTVLAIFDKIRSGEPASVRDLNPDVPRDLETICAKAMAKLAADRYESAEALAEDLERFLAHEAIHARAQTPVDRLVRWGRRHAGKIGTAALVLAALATVAISAQRIALAGRLGEVRVEVRDALGRSLEGEVSIRSIDRVTGIPGRPLPLGPLPLPGATVEPGYYRIVASIDGVGERTYTRWVPGGDTTVVEGLVRNLERAPGAAPDPSAPSPMVLVEAGTVGPEDRSPSIPVHNMAVDVQAFELDVHEVTNAQYRAFLRATGRRAPPHWKELGVEHDALPVVNITCSDAVAYAEWAGKRLPTYVEWLLAARGSEGRRYPWGDDEPLRGVVGRAPMPLTTEQRRAGYFEHVRPPGSDPSAATPSGIQDLFGNVAEWTESPVAMPVEREGQRVYEPLGPHTRLVAGSYWAAGDALVPPDLLHPMIHLDGPVAAGFTTGFRCARDLP
ncbi:Serine/threonine-protein kinase StkP [Planctomycetes bacterium Pla163]|uniref:non-specific serine/threonine protein kinase n=1 Tax=Rohdeia mirabilis TaxID=2528008 RepID=A0A518CYK4_9BACT|nr:Serine/threonine-protein kinase StkP [Planctomycetes bacterium Pla163]